MNTFISLLRGINVGGQKPVRMADLTAAYESLGFTFVTTYVQSGNVVFRCADIDPSNLTAVIETAIARRFGFSVPVILRDRDHFCRLLEGNPFLNPRNEDPSRLHLTFLAAVPSSSDFPAVSVDGEDEYVLKGQDLYLFCPNGYGKTKFSNSFFERRLKVDATTRNWKTVLALAAIADELDNSG